MEQNVININWTKISILIKDISASTEENNCRPTLSSEPKWLPIYEINSILLAVLDNAA